MFDWAKLQAEHREWLAREFPVQPVDVPHAGLVEEAGELLHCALAYRRAEIWGSDPRYPPVKLRADTVDAVGDCCIYCVSYCNSAGIAFSPAEPSLCSTPLRTCMQLVRIAASCEGRSLVRLYSGALQGAACQLGVDFESAVASTWGRVARRRRDRPPKPTKVCLCGSSRFAESHVAALREETLAGRIVLPMGGFGHREPGFDMDGPVKRMLDELHLRKIDEADEILVVDDGGYVGESTRREIAYAEASGKRVRYRSKELCE